MTQHVAHTYIWWVLKFETAETLAEGELTTIATYGTQDPHKSAKAETKQCVLTALQCPTPSLPENWNWGRWKEGINDISNWRIPLSKNGNVVCITHLKTKDLG